LLLLTYRFNHALAASKTCSTHSLHQYLFLLLLRPAHRTVLFRGRPCVAMKSCDRSFVVGTCRRGMGLLLLCLPVNHGRRRTLVLPQGWHSSC
jgi:hypothetical protein